MGGSIYYVPRKGGELVEMVEEPYKTEDVFQELLAEHSKLLAGEQINPTRPRRWLFIAREAGVPDQEEGSGRWSLDHLFLDQDGVPTLVEVKRSQDTRIRREVAGQMLDYAANAVVYWPADEIESKFGETCRKKGSDPNEELEYFLDGETEPDEFWEQVRTNLQAGKIRMLFVADKIPPELRRIIEFMNVQMDPAEVLGVEIKQYVDVEQKAFVARVVGQTAEAIRTKTPPGEKWTEERFFNELRRDSTDDEEAVAKDLLRFGAQASGRAADWGSAKKWGSFSYRVIVNGTRMSLYSVYTTREISLNLGWNRDKIGGAVLSERYRLLVKESLSVDFDRDVWERKWPTAPLAVLVPDKATKLKDIISQYVVEITQLVEEEIE